MKKIKKEETKLQFRDIPLAGWLIKRLKVKQVVFSVYLAKISQSSKWNSSELKDLVKKARQSYLQYGPVPLIDKYDAKSQVYLVSAEYEEKANGKRSRVIEWMSIRFTPADGSPKYHEDFLLSISFSKSLHLIFKELFPQQELKNFVSISRICRVLPQDQTGRTLQHKNRFTLASFALANYCFLKDSSATKNLKYISGLFRPELVAKKFSFKIKNKKIPRYSKLPIALKEKAFSPKLKRNLYIYTYPLYFLQLEQLFVQLQKLFNTGVITQKTLDHYLKIQSLDHVEDIRVKGHLLGSLLSAQGKIKHSRLTGNKLREFLNDTVGDGPELKIMELGEWKKDIQLIITNLKLVV